MVMQPNKTLDVVWIRKTARRSADTGARLILVMKARARAVWTKDGNNVVAEWICETQGRNSRHWDLHLTVTDVEAAKRWLYQTPK